MELDVPLLVPEINPDHLKLVPGQQRARGWKGQIVTNPNCSTIGLVMALGPLKQFGITKVIVTTMQAISGAGYPGVRLDGHHGQRRPLHRRRRRKDGDGDAEDPRRFRRRPHRAAGRQSQRALQSRRRGRWPHRNRLRGILLEALARPTSATRSRVSAACRSSAICPARRRRPVIYMEEANRPQPRKDAERERGMAAFVGRLRPCPVLDYKFVVLSHNTIRGAAGAAVLNAELMHSEGMLD